MQTTDVRIEGHEVLVNGEPHIPFGVIDNYHCGPDEYKRIRDFGLNHVALDSAFKLMTPEGSVQEDVENLRKQLDEARENSLMGLVLFLRGQFASNLSRMEKQRFLQAGSDYVLFGAYLNFLFAVMR